MLFDTHVHFDRLDDGDGCSGVVARARAAGVTRMLAMGGSSDANRFAADVAAGFPDLVLFAIGYDRDQASATGDAAGAARSSGTGLSDEITQLAARGLRPNAIGEIGLDFHYSQDTAAAQTALLAEQLQLAGTLEMPVVIHSREADGATLDVLAAHAAAWRGDSGRMGVLHCFTGTPAFAAALLDLGFMISLSGIVTFRNAAQIREVATLVPADRLLIETDSPYLAPIPHRGKRNEPAFLPHTAALVAELRGMTAEALAELTTANAERLFGGK